MPEITFVPPKERKPLKTFNWIQYPNWLKNRLATGKITKKEYIENLNNFNGRK